VRTASDIGHSNYQTLDFEFTTIDFIKSVTPVSNMTTNEPPNKMPHPVLTPILAEPTTVTVQLLRRQLMANAKAHNTVHNDPDGHLGVIMNDAPYAARHNGVPYVAPVHPGPQAQLVGGHAVIEEAKRVFNLAVDASTRHQNVTETLRQQILQAVPDMYLVVLSDPDFGYDDVTPRAMLNHLETTYAVMTPEEAETNRKTLTATINIDDPLETVWARIITVQQAAPAFAPITDATAITLTLTVFENTGVYNTAVSKWRDKLAAEQTMVNFRLHFDKANKERRHRLTISTAGLHGANNANGTMPQAAANPPRGNGTWRITNRTGWAYCYTHGASTNLRHTSATCTNRCEGHQPAATMDNTMGGSNIIHGPRPNRRNGQQQQPAQN
jgi:hypothetical protein